MMFRITSAKIPDQLIKLVQAGVPVRLITDQRQYRTDKYLWDSYNVDRMYMAGVDVKWKDKSSGQDMHEKAVILHGREFVVFGSSNWTSSSSDKQREHNYFISAQADPTKLGFFDWFVAQFNRKWNNLKNDGSAVSPPMFTDFVPGWPETPVNRSPANAALGVGTSVALRWEGGWWAHKYDIYFGTTNPPPLVAQNFMPGSATAGVVSNKESFNPCTPPAPFVSACPAGLAAGTTYYWRVRGKTMVGDGGGPFSRSGESDIRRGLELHHGRRRSTATGAGKSRRDSGISNPHRLDVDRCPGRSGIQDRTQARQRQQLRMGADRHARRRRGSYQNTSGLTPNTSYNYRVRAWTTGGNSAYSNTVTVATPATSPATGRIVADAYVRAGQYAGTNYGTAVELVAKGSTDPQYRRDAYLKLDISSVQPTSTVTLRLFGKLSDTRAPNVTTTISLLSSSTWNETTVNWNSGLTSGSAWATVVVAGTTSAWYDVDLTDQIRAERAAGRTTIAIALKGTVDTLPPYVSFSSRETANSPQLVITP